MPYIISTNINYSIKKVV